MKLTIADRLTLAGLYPQQSNLITQILVKDLDDKIKLTQKEIKDINLKLLEVKDGEGSYTWDKENEKPLNVKFTDAEIGLLADRVNTLDKENKISLNLVHICSKIRNEQENTVEKKNTEKDK